MTTGAIPIVRNGSPAGGVLELSVPSNELEGDAPGCAEDV
jgi:hypothetical protein